MELPMPPKHLPHQSPHSPMALFSPDPPTPTSFPVTIIFPVAPKSMNLYLQPLIPPFSSPITSRIHSPEAFSQTNEIRAGE
ncbi:hypothetical protein SLA2020_333880 [Shorea laevis]